MKKFLIALSFFTFHFSFAIAQKIEECYRAAENNYPLIKKYDLISKTANLTVDNIAKSWLPQVSASAQATYQSAVTAWPDEMQGLMNQMGMNVKGLKKDQYRIGVDVQQTIYDGGSIRSKQEIARLENDIAAAQTDVNLYDLRQRVTELYFGLLLLEQHLHSYYDRESLLLKNEDKLEKLFKHGAAAECDWKAVRAERISASQAVADLEAQRSLLERMLSVFCGMEKVEPQIPSNTAANLSFGNSQNNVSYAHPKMQLYDKRLSLTQAQERSIDAALRPRLSAFASGYYGYPGYNIFDDMMHHRWTLNGMVGLRLTWNISGLYTRKNDKARIATQRLQIENERDVFLFNSKIDIMQHDAEAARYKEQLRSDDEIISLREAVRKASESKLDHEIIVAADLVRDINQESAARISHNIHEIEMWKAIYLKLIATNEDID